MHRRYVATALAITTLSIAACGDTNVADPVVRVEDSDVEMNAAMQRARDTFPQFLENWQTLPSDIVSVKVGMPTPDDSLEHIWFKPIKIEGDEITGSCGNDAADIPGLKLGDIRKFHQADISDWMILAGKKCYGGYTIRVLTKMEPKNAPPMEFADFDDTK